ncbi:hypothetical protein [Zavarzinella formosa]|uniref:hypothetical protein n=1 Tax=Zavarzinella formosa TaxID=360055 RepID=UPI00031775E6|nr:hypothetical protein [Zavarzinella formosa]
MDWDKVDLTMESVFGGDLQPGLLPMHLRPRERDLYLELFRVDRAGVFRIVDGWAIEAPVFEPEMEQADFHHAMFGEEPHWFVNPDPWAKYWFNSGLACDRCGKYLNLLNRRFYGLCDDCDDEMNMELTRNPQTVFAWDNGI